MVAQVGSSELIGLSPPPTGFTIDATWEAMGGTGRFMNASGSGWLVGTGAIPGDMVLDLGGAIAYDASDRSK